MAKKTWNSRRVAFGGVAAGVSLLCMFLSGVFPFAEYTCPALAGTILIALVIDFGKATAWICYLAIALLSLFITPNKESAILFAGFLGYYPILKNHLEQIRFRPAEWLAKLAVFNIMIVASYLTLIYGFGMSEVMEELNEYSRYGALLFLLAGNVVFVVYDLALTGLIAVYCQNIRPRLRLGK